MVRDLFYRMGWGLHRVVWRASGGRLGARAGRMDVLELTTTGHRSGVPRSVLLYFLRQGDAWVVVASNIGRDRDPDWWTNLRAKPQATVTVGGKTIPVMARPATGGEREQLWDRFVAANRVYAGYEKRTSRAIPVVVLEPAT